MYLNSKDQNARHHRKLLGSILEGVKHLTAEENVHLRHNEKMTSPLQRKSGKYEAKEESIFKNI